MVTMENIPGTTDPYIQNPGTPQVGQPVGPDVAPQPLTMPEIGEPPATPIEVPQPGFNRPEVPQR
jgi:hypothetical protein